MAGYDVNYFYPAVTRLDIHLEGKESKAKTLSVRSRAVNIRQISSRAVS